MKKEIVGVIYTNVLPQVQSDELLKKAMQFDWKFHHDNVYQKLEHRYHNSADARDIVKALKLDNEILRVKFNLCLRRDKHVESWHHVDSVKPHTVILYYLHDTDGDTILKTGEKITPVKNTALVFDGSIEHWHIYPQENDYRITLNIDVEK